MMGTSSPELIMSVPNTKPTSRANVSVRFSTSTTTISDRNNGGTTTTNSALTTSASKTPAAEQPPVLLSSEEESSCDSTSCSSEDHSFTTFSSASSSTTAGTSGSGSGSGFGGGGLSRIKSQKFMPSMNFNSTESPPPPPLKQLERTNYFGVDVRNYTNSQPETPIFDQGLRKFIEPHIAKARKNREQQRLKLFASSSSLSSKSSSSNDHQKNLSIASNTRIPYPTLRHERPFLYDHETYPLHKILADTIHVPPNQDLSTLHTQFPNTDKKDLLQNILDPKKRKAFHTCYDNFVTSICIPLLHSKAMSENENIFHHTTSSSSTSSELQQQLHHHQLSSTHEICYRYQAFPCLRIIQPGEFSIGPHCDMAYGHSIGNINFHIPLTPTFGTNALYTESHPGREDWHPLTTKCLGLGYIFDGARCLHFSLENMTEQTRVTLDFRIAICRKSSRVPRSIRNMTFGGSGRSSRRSTTNNEEKHDGLSSSSEDEEEDVNDALCSEKMLQDSYSIISGYYDEAYVDVGETSSSSSHRQQQQHNCYFTPGSVVYKKKNRGDELLQPDKRVGFPF